MDNTVRLWGVTQRECFAVAEWVSGILSVKFLLNSSQQAMFLATGDTGGTACLWRLKKEGLPCQWKIELAWCQGSYRLSLNEAVIQSAQGLSLNNTTLLTQRGAKGNPNGNFSEFLPLPSATNEFSKNIMRPILSFRTRCHSAPPPSDRLYARRTILRKLSL